MVQMIDEFDWDRDDDHWGKQLYRCLVGMIPSRDTFTVTMAYWL
jgi:hypothetical protein